MELRKQASESQKQHDVSHSTSKESGIRTQFKVGDQVLLSYPPKSDGSSGRPNKLCTNHRGPYTIEKVLKDDMYTLRSANGKRKDDISVHRLSLFSYDKAHINPIDEGYRDDQLHIVDKILSHKGKMNAKKSLSFEVKWKGYNTTTFEPWKEVKNLVQMHDYLKSKNLGRYIPKEHVVVAEDSDSASELSVYEE